MFVVSIEQSGPLLGTDTKTSVHSHLDDLTIVLSTERLVRTKLQVHKKTREHDHVVCVCVCVCVCVHVCVTSLQMSFLSINHIMKHNYRKLNRNYDSVCTLQD